MTPAIAEASDASPDPSAYPNSTCGDGMLDDLEICDDGNLVDDDGCDTSCQPSGVASMSVGDDMTCAVTHAGNVKCWGHNEQGQLGRGDFVSIGEAEVADADFIDLGGRAHAVHTNGRQTYALLDTGEVRAWGINDLGQLGLMHTVRIGDDEMPADATVSVDLQLGGYVEQLAVGGDFACALLDTGLVRCWGANDSGQLGYGHTERIGDDESPMGMSVSLGVPAVSVVAGARHACALLDDGSVWCWGSNDAGQLGSSGVDAIGDDEHPDSWGPVQLGGTVAELAAGDRHTCARLDDGRVQCWGANDQGQLGQGNSDMTVMGVVDVPLDGVATTLAAGAGRTCVLLNGGALSCWGASGPVQLEPMPSSSELFMGSSTSSLGVLRTDGSMLYQDDAMSSAGSNVTAAGTVREIIVVKKGDV